MAKCLIALGSNLGMREQSLDHALAKLNAQPGVRVVARSKWHRTAPIGGPAGQGEFLNGAALLETSIDPVSLCVLLQQIENELGRRRIEVWGARTLDLDLLLYEDRVLNEPQVTIPHPRMTFRRFVLEPAAEVAADMRHPMTGSTVRELLAHLNTTPRYLAIAGTNRVAKTDLARRLHQEFGAALLLAEPTGLSPSDPISFWHTWFERLARQLQQAVAGAGQAWLVSDFWFGELLSQMLSELRHQGDGDAENWLQIFLQTPQPKLILLLNELPDRGLAQLPQPESRGIYHGPQLKLDAANLDEAHRQARAALLAM